MANIAIDTMRVMTRWTIFHRMGMKRSTTAKTVGPRVTIERR
jgi:hypothetical protein